MAVARSIFGPVFVLLICLGIGLLVGWLVGGGIIKPQNPNSILEKLIQPKPGKCLVLEARYCRKAAPAYYKNDQLMMIGFRLPAGTPIFAPFTGTFSRPSVPLTSDGKEQIYQALGLFSDEALLFGGIERALYSLTILMADESAITGLHGQPVSKGAIVARIPAGDATLLGKYNLILAFGRFSPEIKMFANDLDSVKSNFGL